MKFKYNFLFFLLACAFMNAPVFATTEDLYIQFVYDAQGDSVIRLDPLKNCVLVHDANGACREHQRTMPHVRLLVLGAQKRKSSIYSHYIIQNPFLIIDGINLEAKARPLVSDNDTVLGFYEEIKLINRSDDVYRPEEPAGNLLGGLQAAGYTPVLVQLTRTTQFSLEWNAKICAALLRYLGRSALGSKNFMGVSPFLGQGFNILGISQGGVIGRYGAYLYDTRRAGKGLPIRMFASLDAPHQGAVMPRGLMATVDFWGRQRSKAEAKSFLDRVQSPGAKDLLLYSIVPPVSVDPQRSYGLKGSVEWSASTDRWLFGTYRLAAQYQGFPVVLLSNGQLDGELNSSTVTPYYHLNRWAEKGGGVWGRAVSRFGYSSEETGEYAYNRTYEFAKSPVESVQKGSSRWDLVQGSTYPFIDAMYQAFEPAMKEAIPDREDVCVYRNILGCQYSLRFYGKWDDHTQQRSSTTFIPTTSSLDWQCDGDLSVRSECAFTQTSHGVEWENPGDRSTANALYAVDPSHPGSKRPNSGRHVIGATATLDLWRLFCEVAKRDYDEEAQRFRNPSLQGHFDPHASCMDPSSVSLWFLEHVAPTDFSNHYKFPWARWTFNSAKIDKQFPVSFHLPAGWQVVGLLDRGKSLEANDVIEVTLKTNPTFKGNWMRVEWALSTTKSGAEWWQLSEQSVPADGAEHTLRWQLPNSSVALNRYRWARLIMNSLGGGVTVTSIRITHSSLGTLAPEPIQSPIVYPPTGSQWTLGAWGQHQPDFSDSYGSGVALSMPVTGDGAYWFLNDYADVSAYRQLQLTYWPNTCQKTRIYFDKKDHKYNAETGSIGSNSVALSGGDVSGDFLVKTIPLLSIIDTLSTPHQTLSAQRLYFQSFGPSETCIIKEMRLQ